MPFRLKKNIKPNCLLKHSINTELNWSSFYLIQSIATWGIFNHLNLCIFVFLGLFLAIFAKQVKKKLLLSIQSKPKILPQYVEWYKHVCLKPE